MSNKIKTDMTKKLKLIIRSLIGFIVLNLWLYLAICFINKDMNIFNLSINYRQGIVCIDSLYLFGCILIFILD